MSPTTRKAERLVRGVAFVLWLAAWVSLVANLAAYELHPFAGPELNVTAVLWKCAHLGLASLAYLANTVWLLVLSRGILLGWEALQHLRSLAHAEENSG